MKRLFLVYLDTEAGSLESSIPHLVVCISGVSLVFVFDKSITGVANESIPLRLRKSKTICYSGPKVVHESGAIHVPEKEKYQKDGRHKELKGEGGSWLRQSWGFVHSSAIFDAVPRGIVSSFVRMAMGAGS